LLGTDLHFITGAVRARTHSRTNGSRVRDERSAPDRWRDSPQPVPPAAHGPQGAEAEDASPAGGGSAAAGPGRGLAGGLGWGGGGAVRAARARKGEGRVLGREERLKSQRPSTHADMRGLPHAVASTLLSTSNGVRATLGPQPGGPGLAPPELSLPLHAPPQQQHADVRPPPPRAGPSPTSDPELPTSPYGSPRAASALRAAAGAALGAAGGLFRRSVTGTAAPASSGAGREGGPAGVMAGAGRGLVSAYTLRDGALFDISLQGGRGRAGAVH
jgi:hypothetical protein